jgi:DNA segregation ATPase FtsK/SpoIIIE-like protein
MRKVVTGSQVAQLRGPDPFTVPAWRSPVYRTPFLTVAVVQAARLAWRVLGFVLRRPAGIACGIAVMLAWQVVGWRALAALAAIIPALPIAERADLRALPVGKRENGQPWLVRVHGTHLLIAGATGAGKASLLWSVVRAMLPAIAAGLVRVQAADPKLMELAFGRTIFDRYGRYAADPESIVAMLEDAVTQMQERAAQFAGKHREHTPTLEHPFVVIVVDEVAFLIAYQPDRHLRDRVKAALATLTTQGRAVGLP